ncbi:MULTISPECIES: hypothetical protein [Cupriavidus]|jgi:hypothetical protein|uniref:hypothetical protein n=1 Tax=unclassified Cupriavidus TaxID=2640874 RepID=UPI001268E2BB|nr:hypothetical protein [Cupriavidus sp. SK-3]
MHLPGRLAGQPDSQPLPALCRAVAGPAFRFLQIRAITRNARQDIQNIAKSRRISNHVKQRCALPQPVKRVLNVSKISLILKK